MKIYGIIFGIIGFLAVAFGAFGAHVLRNSFSNEDMSIYQTAVHYQFFHALAALVALSLYEFKKIQAFKKATLLFFIGIFIFSGSLYILTCTGLRWFGAITPLGGIALLVGWFFMIKGFYSWDKK